MSDDFVWHSDIEESKPIFLDKRDTYINLHQLDSMSRSDIIFVYKAGTVANPIGTLLFRYYKSNYAYNIHRSFYNIKRLHELWFNTIPLQDFYYFIE